MTRILHLSDLHFGRERPGLVPVLAYQIRMLAPDLLVVCGDLTAGGLADDFAHAQDLFAALALPVLAVPGKRDLPRYNPFARFLCPYRLFRREISADIEPLYDRGDLLASGVNTSNPFAWRRGLIRSASLDLAKARLSRARAAQLRVMALSHPLTGGAEGEGEILQGAAEARAALIGAGADLVLCGYQRQALRAPCLITEGGRSAVQLQAGSALSGRLSEPINSFNLIETGAARISLTRYDADARDQIFRAKPPQVFTQISPAAGWQLAAG